MPFCRVRRVARKPLPKGYPVSVETLGLELRRWRMDRELSQVKLAGLLGVSKSTVENWELGETEPARERLSAIGQLLGRVVEAPGAGLAEQVATYRRAAGLTRTALARQLGVMETTLLRWERGERLPRKSSRGVVERLLRSVDVLSTQKHGGADQDRTAPTT